MSGCTCLYLQDLDQAFTSKRASAYLVWDQAVKLDYVDDATIALIDNPCAQGLTIKEVVVKTIAEKGADPEGGAQILNRHKVARRPLPR